MDLTGAEYRLLCLLARNADRVVTRDAILEELWDGGGSFVDDNMLSVYARRLRGKIETDPSRPEHLLTARGFGYRWKPCRRFEASSAAGNLAGGLKLRLPPGTLPEV